LKSIAVISRGFAILSVNASTSINTTTITESISTIASILLSMVDIVSAVSPTMAIETAMFCHRFFDDYPGAINKSSFWTLKSIPPESLSFI
jgi:hypothetical protein